MYDTQPEADDDLRSDERAHARLLADLPPQHPAGLAGKALARVAGRHRSPGGNALRAAMLGANDGLVSNRSLVTGAAGLTFAIGGLWAWALSERVARHPCTAPIPRAAGAGPHPVGVPSVFLVVRVLLAPA
jgi:hypothetical protein